MHPSRTFIPVCRPFVGEEESAAASRVIKSAWLSTGSEAQAFENELAQQFKAEVVAVSSASVGLILALVAHGVGRGDEVILPAISFVATSNAVIHAGAKPVFADVDPANGLMDSEDALSRISERTRAIISVDLYGQSTDWSPYRELCKTRRQIALIEDAAQAFGTAGVGGQVGITEVFSFYATKNVAMGEGGAVVTTDPYIASKVRILSQQGVTADAFARYHGFRNYDVVEIGYKANLPDVLAAIGRAQLRKLTDMQAMRQRACEEYRRRIPLPTISWARATNYHLYPIFVDDRNGFRSALAEQGVGTGVHFECIPGHLAYRKLGYCPEDTPNAAEFGAHEVTLPTFAGLTTEDQDRVVRATLAWRSSRRPAPQSVTV